MNRTARAVMGMVVLAGAAQDRRRHRRPAIDLPEQD
jgi:hypothetical protein